MIDNTNRFQLEKSVWTEIDFEQMGWHDASIYGIASTGNSAEPWENEFLLDIDYIFKWVDPKPPNSHFTFWVSPCTLIFRNIYDLVVDFDLSGFSTVGIEVDSLNLIETIRNNDGPLYHSWEIGLHYGNISLKSEGYIQVVRKAPSHCESQQLSLDQRGGVSFDKVPCSILNV